MIIKRLFLIFILFVFVNNSYGQQLTNKSILLLKALGYKCKTDENVIVIPYGGCTGCKKELIDKIIKGKLYQKNFIVVHPEFSFYFENIHSKNLVIDKDLRFLKSDKVFLADAIIMNAGCNDLSTWKIIQFVPQTNDDLLKKLK